jgi:hypothetical protein
MLSGIPHRPLHSPRTFPGIIIIIIYFSLSQASSLAKDVSQVHYVSNTQVRTLIHKYSHT